MMSMIVIVEARAVPLNTKMISLEYEGKARFNAYGSKIFKVCKRLSPSASQLSHWPLEIAFTAPWNNWVE